MQIRASGRFVDGVGLGQACSESHLARICLQIERLSEVGECQVQVLGKLRSHRLELRLTLGHPIELPGHILLLVQCHRLR